MKPFLILFFCLLKISPLSAQCSINLSYTPASCPTCCDGCITVNVISGCPPYTISWYPSDPTFPLPCGACADTTYIAPVTDNCACTSTDTITPTGTTGINIFSPDNNISIFPNPSSSLLIVKISLPNDFLYAVISDIYGAVLFREKLNNIENVINTNQFASGVYFISIQNDRQILRTEKWVKTQ